jgi:class 3 adenylate cyclase
LQGAGSIELEVSDDVSTSQWHIDLTKTKARLALNTSFVATAQIEGERARLLVIEEPQLTDTALRPGRILSATDFRDLFSQEHLKSNVKLHLGEQTILFTDIVGSTNFYKAVGDAKAFSEVRQHFEEVLAEIRNHDGVLVKTIGDAAMAAFARTDYALEAAIQIQNRFQRSRLDTSIRLRISVHVGPVIAVNLDTGVDYFGSTVNLAAKIQSCADAHQIALSSAAYAHWQKKFGDKFSTKQVSHKRDTSRPEPVFVITV